MSHTDISLVYENSDGKEAVLTYTPETHAIYGTFEVQKIEEMGSQNFRKSKPLILNSGDKYSLYFFLFHFLCNNTYYQLTFILNNTDAS